MTYDPKQMHAATVLHLLEYYKGNNPEVAKYIPTFRGILRRPHSDLEDFNALGIDLNEIDKICARNQ